MNTSRPFMLLRARVGPGLRPEFDRWFDSDHLRDVAAIPGIVAVKKGRNADGTRLGVYTFESSDVLQGALASPEAAYARGTWDQWQPNLEELLIEMWAAVFHIPLYSSVN